MIDSGIDVAAVLASAVELGFDALVIVDRKDGGPLSDARIVYANAAVEKLTGFHPSALIGRPLSALAPEDAAMGSASWLVSRAGDSPVQMQVAVREFAAGEDAQPFAAISMRESAESTAAVCEAETVPEFGEIFRLNPCPMWVYDLETLRFAAVNEAACKRYGYTRDEFAGMKMTDISADGREDRLLSWLQEYRAAPLHGGVSKHRTKSGDVVDAEIHSAPIVWRGREARIVTMNDITERQQLVTALQRAEDVLSTAQRAARLGSFEFDLHTRSLACSDELYSILGLPPTTKIVALDDLMRHLHPEDKEYVARTIRDASQSGSRYTVDHRILRSDGMIRWVTQRGQSVLGGDAKPVRVVGTLQDITDRKESEERLAFLAHHDSLTGLPNRNLLVDRLSQILTHAQRNKRLAALLFSDLDNFKHVNDTMGHHCGDRLLQAVAKRLRTSVRGGDIVARPGGDEFIIVLADVARVDVAAKIAQKIINAFSAPFDTDDGELFITASIGVTIYPHDGEDADQLIRRADTAMYQAKENGRNKFQFFAPTMQDAAVSRLSLESDLRRALGRGEFFLHYQPLVDSNTGTIVAAEALLRWKHPARGIVYPADFLAVADETGLMTTIGEWVLRTACATARTWQRDGRRLPLAVNLSPKQFAQPKLIGCVSAALRESNLPPSALELELTESALAKDPDTSRRMFEALHELGVRFSVDSFGAGYSSLEQLRSYPFETLKIGRNIVAGIEAEESSAAVAASIIALARGLGRRVVAVGVESAEQVKALRRLGCDQMQGYLFGRPEPADEFADRLKL